MKAIIGILTGALLAISLLGHGQPARAAEAEPPSGGKAAEGTFLQLADIHFTPFSDAATLAKLVASPVEDWPAIFSAAPATIAGLPDTDYPLLMGTLHSAQQRARYDFVINTGDHLAHHFRETYVALGGPAAQFDQFAAKTLVFVYRSEKAAFPDTPVITTLGNNDDACGDYQGDQPDPTSKALAQMLVPVEASAAARDDAARIGSYVVPMPHTERRDVIVLADTDWSDHFKTCAGGDGAAQSAATLQWLAGTLAAERRAGRTALLVMHIPPGVNTFSSKACPAPGRTFWTSAALDAFDHLASSYRDVLKVAIAGHTHMDDFRVVIDRDRPALAVRISPAVTPLFGNHPAYTLFEYDRAGGAIEDYATWSVDNRSHAADAHAWKLLYRFGAQYGYRGFTPENVLALAKTLRTDEGALKRAYENNFAAGGKSPVTDANWLTYSCAQVVLADPQFAACRCP
jgi:hypothetical protein